MCLKMCVLVNTNTPGDVLRLREQHPLLSAQTNGDILSPRIENVAGDSNYPAGSH